MDEEKRANIRAAANLPVKWDGASGRHETRVEDIGLGGCFIKTTSHVDLNQFISLQIRFPRDDWVRFDGWVVSYHPGIGFALRFSRLTQEQENAVKRLL